MKINKEYNFYFYGKNQGAITGSFGDVINLYKNSNDEYKAIGVTKGDHSVDIYNNINGDGQSEDLNNSYFKDDRLITFNAIMIIEGSLSS